jgi:adenylate cyclase
MTDRQLQLDFTRTDGLTQRVTVGPGESVMLGRDLTCDCRLEGRKVSRRHFTIHMADDGRVRIEDHGSHNGTFVNGVRIVESALAGGEVVSVGEWEGRVVFNSKELRRRTVPGVMPAISMKSNPPPPNASPLASVPGGLPISAQMEVADAPTGFDQSDPGTIKEPAADSTRVVDMTQVWQWQEGEQEKASVSEDTMRAAPVEKNPIVRALTMGVGSQLDFRGLQDLEQIQPSAPQKIATPGANFNVDAVALRLVFQVMESLHASASMGAFLDDMSDSLLSAARAKAVVVLLPDTTTGDLHPEVVKNRRQEESVEISRTVIDHAMRTRSAITTEDASADERFASGESVLRFDLKAVLCVPLVRENEVTGAVYLTRDLPFTETELDLVAALAQMIAIGLDRARLREQIETEAQTRRALERFHAPDVVRRLMMEDQGTMSGARATTGLFLETLSATILFCDLSGFTTFCENNDPEVVGRVLNSYLGHMTEIVFEHGGTVDKYIGDAIMCIFGAPFMAEDDAMRAVRCAVAMRTTFQQMVDDGDLQGLSKHMHVHIGVNTGQVVAGTVGSSRRMEYTALGDTVNLAARLEGVAGAGQIVIGPQTAELVQGLFPLRSLGRVPIKGKSSEVEVWEVLDDDLYSRGEMTVDGSLPSKAG